MRSFRSFAVVVTCAFAFTSASFAEAPAPAKKEEPKKAEACEPHGVSKGLCTRCNPKLEAAFKAKNDWCPEHARPESQCVICNPKLAKQGVK